MKNIFITAIGTDSGKTLVSAIFCEALKIGYWKPIQAGTPRDTDTVASLISDPIVKTYPEKWLLKTPSSPHAAAKIDAVSIRISEIDLPTAERIVIEGAGGCMVPLNDDEFVIDIASQLDCEVVLVSNLYLGSINHTLLTLHLLKSKNISVKGIVFNGPSNAESERIILHHAGYPCLLRIDQEEKIDRQSVSRYARELLKKWK